MTSSPANKIARLTPVSVGGGGEGAVVAEYSGLTTGAQPRGHRAGAGREHLVHRVQHRQGGQADPAVDPTSTGAQPTIDEFPLPDRPVHPSGSPPGPTATSGSPSPGTGNIAADEHLGHGHRRLRHARAPPEYHHHGSRWQPLVRRAQRQPGRAHHDRARPAGVQQHRADHRSRSGQSGHGQSLSLDRERVGPAGDRVEGHCPAHRASATPSPTTWTSCSRARRARTSMLASRRRLASGQHDLTSYPANGITLNFSDDGASRSPTPTRWSPASTSRPTSDRADEPDRR